MSHAYTTVHEPLTTQLVAELMRDLLVAFPSRHSSQNLVHTAEVYRNGLRGVSGEALRAAVDLHIKSGEFFPKVGKLRELASEWARRNRATATINAPEEWGVCAQCGARAELKSNPRQVRDPERHYALVWDGIDEHGQPIPRMEPGPLRYVIDHVGPAHGIYPAGDGPDARQA